MLLIPSLIPFIGIEIVYPLTSHPLPILINILIRRQTLKVGWLPIRKLRTKVFLKYIRRLIRQLKRGRIYCLGRRHLIEPKDPRT